MAKSKLLPKLNWVIPSNELYININDPEVTGKQYQNFANAFAYIPNPVPSLNNPRAVKFVGVWPDPIIVPEWITLKGEWPESSLMNWAVSFANLSSPYPYCGNNVSDVAITSLSIAWQQWAFQPSSVANNEAQAYVAQILPIYYIGSPNHGTFDIDIDGRIIAWLAWNVSAADMQTKIRATDTNFVNYVVTGDYNNWWNISTDGTPVNHTFAFNLTDHTNWAIHKWWIIFGRVQSTTIIFDNFPDSWQWRAKITYKWVTYYSQLMTSYESVQSIENVIRNLLTDIYVATLDDLWYTQLTVNGNYDPTSGFTITYNGCPNELTDWIVCDTVPAKATYTWTVMWMTSPVTIEAVTAGNNGNWIWMDFDWIKTINEAISQFNAWNPTNQCILISGDWTQIPDIKNNIQLSWGYDMSMWAYGTASAQYASFDNVKLMWWEVQYMGWLYFKNSKIYWGIFSPAEYFELRQTEIIADWYIQLPSCIKMIGGQIDDWMFNIVYAGWYFYDVVFTSAVHFGAGVYEFYNCTFKWPVTVQDGSNIEFVNSSMVRLSVDDNASVVTRDCKIDTLILQSLATYQNIGASYDNRNSWLGSQDMQAVVDELAANTSNLSWSGDPTWVVTPDRDMQPYKNTDDNTIYMSVWLTSSDRVQLSTFTS